MTDWRFWITYTGRIHTDTDDEDVARLAAAQEHAELIREPNSSHHPLVEVEEIEGARND